MEEHISGLVSSVVNGKRYGKQDFTADLPPVFIEPSRYEHPVSQWNRYVDFMRGLALRRARDDYWVDMNQTLLADKFMEAYYEASEMRKQSYS
jgi:hypothetical protein